MLVEARWLGELRASVQPGVTLFSFPLFPGSDIVDRVSNEIISLIFHFFIDSSPRINIISQTQNQQICRRINFHMEPNKGCEELLPKSGWLPCCCAPKSITLVQCSSTKL